MNALAKVRRATARRSRVSTEWKQAIREAVEAGASLRAVGEAAGVSHVRVLQITQQPDDS